MKIIRLAKLFEAKYGLISEAISHREKFLQKLKELALPPGPVTRKKTEKTDTFKKRQFNPNDPNFIARLEKDPDVIKQNLKNAYRTYILNPPKAYNILPLLANKNEPFVNDFIKAFEVLLSSMDNIKLETLFDRINDLLGMIASSQADNTVRQNIHLIFSTPSDREIAKNKYERVLYELVGHILFMQASSLQEIFKKIESKSKESDESEESDESDELKKSPAKEPDALKWFPTDAKRRQLSKDELWMFMKTPAAQKYGLDNLDVMEKILLYPELRDKITRLVNAIKRGQIPIVGPEISKETAEIIAAFKAKQTNEYAFENPESDLGNPQLEYSRRPRKEPAFEGPDPDYDPKFVEEQRKQEQQRLKLQDVAEQDRKEKEEELINKYNSLSFSDWLKRSSR